MKFSRETWVAAAALLLAGQTAAEAAGTGSGALELAALVARHSPLVTHQEVRAMATMFEGSSNFIFPAGKKIRVKADAVSCRASNVDLTRHSCELTFGRATVALDGREAHEFFATMAEVGVPAEGAAGSIFENLANLDCSIDPNQIKERAGGGAECNSPRSGAELPKDRGFAAETSTGSAALRTFG